ncbi:glycosyltransferase family 2 protein [Pseudophaeobacter sp.]|uniref:glycosyltransferase family 2 protein n=1 Tax=Pseudophaeobacter sp. TaxID=1971739 RepID=UPI004059D1F5
MQSFLVQENTVFKYTAEFSQFSYANISFFDREQQNILFHVSLRQEDGLCVCNKRSGETWAAEKIKTAALAKSGVEVAITFSPPHVTVALDGKKIFRFGRGVLRRPYPNLDQITYVSFQGGIAAQDIDYGDSNPATSIFGALNRSNRAKLDKGQLCLSNRLELRARLPLAPDSAALSLDLPGLPSPPKVILSPRGDRNDAKRDTEELTDITVLLPGRIWEGVSDTATLDLGLLQPDGDQACPRLQLSRQDMATEIETILAETDLYGDSLAAMQVFEHLQFGGLLPMLSAKSRAAVASAQRFYGLSNYIVAVDKAPDGQIDQTSELKTAPAREGDAVTQAQATFGKAMRDNPQADPLEVLAPLLRALPKDERRFLFLALIGFFCEPDRDFDGFHELYCKEQLAGSLSPDTGNLFKTSAVLPFLLLEGRHSEICPAIRSLIAPNSAWLLTPALARLMLKIIDADNLEEKIRENILYAYFDLVNRLADDYWEHTHCTNLTEVAVQLLLRMDSFADYTHRLTVDFVIRVYGLSRQFWHRVDATDALAAAPELAPLRQAFAVIERSVDAPEADPTLAKALDLFHHYSPVDLKRMRRELLGPAGVQTNTGEELTQIALKQAGLQVEEATVRHMAYPGADPVSEDLVEVAAATLPGLYPDVPRAPYYQLQSEVSRLMQSLLEQAATQTLSAEDITGLGAKLRLISSRRTRYLGLGMTLAMIRGLLPHPGQEQALSLLVKQLQQLFAVLPNEERAELGRATAPRLALLALRDTPGAAEIFAQVNKALPGVAELLPVTDPLPAGAPELSASPLFDTIVTVFSCLPNLDSRIPAMRAGWLSLLKALEIPYVIAVGNGDGRIEGDVVHLDAPDNYEGLPQKTLAAIRWVHDNTRFAHMVKIDDDCFLNPDVFFLSQSYRKFDYYGRILNRRPGQMDRSWHNEKSTSERGRLELDKSPEPSLYTDGGCGYALSRTAMAAALTAAHSPAGQYLIQLSFMEDKLLGDLLAQQGIYPTGEDYRTSVRRRNWSKAKPVSLWVNSFDASRAAPVSLVHLDEHETQGLAKARLTSSELHPKKIWPSFQDVALGFNVNALELISGEDRLEAARSAEVAVVACMRNEMFMLPQFLAHYRKLGVGSFLIADNCSDDGTLEYLLEQPDVALFSVDTDYSKSYYGVSWQQAMMAAFRVGKWSLVADADELLAWQKNQVQSLPELLQTKDFQGADAARIFMLDMYPKGPLSDVTFETNPFAEAGFVDRAPFLTDVVSLGPFSNMPTWTSAVRHRLIPGSRPEIFVAQKVALLKYQPWMRLSAGLHYLADVRLSPRELVFAHFKYNADFHRKAQEEVSRRQHFNDAEEYQKYLALMSEGRDVIYEEGLSIPWNQAPFVKARLEDN